MMQYLLFFSPPAVAEKEEDTITTHANTVHVKHVVSKIINASSTVLCDIEPIFVLVGN